MMNKILISLLAVAFMAKHTFGFVSHAVVIKGASPASKLHSTAQSEAERLLAKARELRQQAEAAEKEIHSSQTQKKSQQQAHLDGLIETVLSSNNNKKVVVQKLKDKHVSMETLEHMLDRLDDRLQIAEGGEHITCAFEKQQLPRDEKEMNVLKQKIDTLLQAVQVLDDEFRRAHSNNKSVGGVAGDSCSDGSGSLLYSVSSVEASHWGGGHAHELLTQRLHEKQRAREEQFQKRQEEFYEAQRIKNKDQKVDKVKDDHGFLP